MRQRVYIGLDAHIRHCVLAGMDTRGKLLFSERLPTSEAALISVPGMFNSLEVQVLYPAR